MLGMLEVESDNVIISLGSLQEGNLSTVTVTDKSDNLIIAAIGRTTVDALTESNNCLRASLSGQKYHPRACVYSPHRDY